MNKTSILPKISLPRIILVFAACTLFCVVSIQQAEADGAPPPDPSVGSAGPYRPQKTNVQMMSETVLIDVPEQKQPTPTSPEPPKVHVSASFTMRNQGKTEEKMQVIFPLSQLTWPTEEQADYRVNRSSFTAKVDGQPVPITEITTPVEEGYTYEYDQESGEPTRGFLPSVNWAAFEVNFPVYKNVLLQVEYDMAGFYEIGFTDVVYILETGAGWYGKIQSADLSLRLPYQATEEVIRYANPGYTLSGNEIRWHLKNIEPTRKDNLSVGVYSSETWQEILELRAKVAKNPEDVETWSTLGDKYTSLGISTHMMDMSSYYILNNHFANLAIDSYQKALTLRSAWGDPHFAIAKILWAQNASRKDLQLEDPAVQRILSELKPGLTYGITNDYEMEDLLRNINMHIPGMALTLQPSPTITTTSLPTPVATTQPTTVLSPTPTQTQQVILTTNIVMDDKGVAMRRVPAGRFIVGNSNRQVYLDSYDIDQYEVTNALYKDCVATGKCSRPKQTYSYTRPSYYGNSEFDNYPVVDVDWNMAKAYCEWRGVRMPTEAEWEKAARGLNGRIYPWGDTVEDTYANYGQIVGDTSAVGSYESGKSVYGVYDIAGNVWEWTADFYTGQYSSSVQENPLGPHDSLAYNRSHGIRGGSWYNTNDVIQSTYRIPVASTYSNLLIGFRCARSIPPFQVDNNSGKNGKATPQSATKKLVDEKGITMRIVPAGEFMMGSENGDTNEKPVHKVFLDSFAIDQYEVTNAFYKACVDASICAKPYGYLSATILYRLYYGNSEFDNYPVINVNWKMAKTYCEWRGARLPSEAEWEKAARGTDGRSYPWGEGIDKTYANFNLSDTTAVGRYEKGKSVHSVYDMAGNVWEWVNDWYEEEYYQSSPLANPLGPDTGKYHVLRGGSWYIADFGVRSAYRSFGTPDYTRLTIGFRCARSLP